MTLLPTSPATGLTAAPLPHVAAAPLSHVAASPPTRRPQARHPRGGAADVVYVFCLLQVAFLMLGALGEIVLMGGNPAYLVVPLVKVALLLVLATAVVSGRRWALVTLIVVQGVTIVGFWLQIAIGFLPWVTFTLSLTVVLTNLVLPGIACYLCALVLAEGRDRRSERIGVTS